MYHVAKSLLYNDADCQDAIQETIAKAFDKIGTLKQDTYAKTWLIRILINECYGIMRKEKKIISLETCEREEPWMERQDYSDLYEALMRLTEEARLAVTLYYMEGYSIREIARMTRVTESAVKNRLARARTKLKEELSKEDILKRIQEGGVVGQGGAGFPTHVKLSPKEPDKIDHILVNGAECEPYITSDYRRMMEEPENVVKGLEVILKVFPKAVGCICIEDNKPDCIAKMKEAIKGKERMEVKELKTKYPQGGERTLIYAVTGREINSTMLPADVGCVVDNVETVTSVYKAVILGQPVISRNLTVTGDGIRTPKNFSVLTGTDLSELVNKCITQTLTRSIYTSLTTFIMVAVLFIMGVSSIREFAAPLMVGIVCGGYSSVCVTGALWYVMKTKVGKKAQPKKKKK